MTSETTSIGHAFVTGGRRGIGRGIALEMARKGFDVSIGDLVADADADETLQGIRAHGVRAAFVPCDVADLDAHDAVLDQVEQALGLISCLVNNAGISVAKRGDLLEATPESFDQLMRVNLRGPFFLTQKLARRFVARGAGHAYRSIVNISSANAYAASPNRGEYCVSKTAVSMTTKLFAARLGELGIGVFEIRPGVIRTSMTAVAAADYDKKIAAGLSPMPRWGEAQDVGRAAAALASGDFAFSTGDAIHVDGGLHIQRL
ncbi:3-ketoacyl-ACP reductase [Variovorax sp. KK3]|uniref:3-ketoacyl-ACP reductase n=1 Tax=Variovorax sp. KK3 TaxID=1855728 RepID=UPI00097C84CB|nr:3-ketoacyl-ACP reductase [Variovorax sp. KK3]